MSHVANCIKELTDKYDDFLKPDKLNLLSCDKYIDAQNLDVEGKSLLDRARNQILQQVMVITNAEAYEEVKELWKHKTRIKKEEQQKFISDKRLLLGLILGLVDPKIK